MNKLYVEASFIYNSQIRNEDLTPSEKAKTDIYAKGDNGRSYSPAWYTVNLKASFQLSTNFLLTTG